MTHEQIAANARLPYAEAIKRMNARICATVDQLAYVYPGASEDDKAKLIREAIFQLRQAASGQ